MKHLDDVSAMCGECMGNGCKHCMGTGNMPKEAHILWLQDMIKRKNKFPVEVMQWLGFWKSVIPAEAHDTLQEMCLHNIPPKSLS